MTSNTSINESISALIDDESDDLDLKRVLGDFERGGDVPSTWSRYQLIGSVMRKQQVNLEQLNFADRVSDAIDQEVSLKAGPAAWVTWRSGLGKVAVAATVAVAFVIGFDTLDNQLGDEATVAQVPLLSTPTNTTLPQGFQLPTLSASTVSTGGASISSSQSGVTYLPLLSQNEVPASLTPRQSAELQSLLGELMQSHVEQSTKAGAFGVLPMARLSAPVDNASPEKK